MQLKLKKSICFSVFISTLFYKEGYLFCAYLAAFIHECAHGAAAYVSGIKPKGIKIGILGMNLTLPHFLSSKDKIVIYLAGPVASFAVWGYFFVAKKLFFLDYGIMGFFAFSNFVIGVINLLPVFPLDGGIILKSVFATYTGIIRGAKKCRRVSDVLIVLSGILTLVLLYCRIFNLSLTVIFLFLILNRNKEIYLNISEKRKVLSGEVPVGNILKYMACDASSELLCLAEYISYDYTLVVATFHKDKFFCDLNQNDIIYGIKKYGALCTVREYVGFESKL